MLNRQNQMVAERLRMCTQAYKYIRFSLIIWSIWGFFSQLKFSFVQKKIVFKEVDRLGNWTNNYNIQVNKLWPLRIEIKTKIEQQPSTSNCGDYGWKW